MHHGKRVTPISNDLPTARLVRPFDAGDLDLPAEGRVLFLRARNGPMLSALPQDRTDLVQGHAGHAAALSATGHNVAALLPHHPPYALALMEMTKHKAESRGMFATAWNAVTTGGTIVVSGAKTDGVDALIKDLRKVLPLDGSQAKFHGKVFWITRTAETPPLLADWDAAMTPRANADGFVTAPGMFSADGIDLASALLAHALPVKLGKRVADLGAGWGYLSHEALAKSEGIETLDLYEAEAAALEAAKANISDPRAGFHWTDVTRQTTQTPYDSVIMNPPFHAGRAADAGLGQDFITTAARLLKPKGRLFMVANRHLPYEAVLKKAFRKVSDLPNSSGFKLILGEGPLRKPG